jgi:hypothetical protein
LKRKVDAQEMESEGENRQKKRRGAKKQIGKIDELSMVATVHPRQPQ